MRSTLHDADGLDGADGVARHWYTGAVYLSNLVCGEGQSLPVQRSYNDTPGATVQCVRKGDLGSFSSFQRNDVLVNFRAAPSEPNR